MAESNTDMVSLPRADVERIREAASAFFGSFGVVSALGLMLQKEYPNSPVAEIKRISKELHDSIAALPAADGSMGEGGSPPTLASAQAMADGAQLGAALEFYASEADALSRYYEAGNSTALEATLTVLRLDGGRRGREALARLQAPMLEMQLKPGVTAEYVLEKLRGLPGMVVTSRGWEPGKEDFARDPELDAFLDTYEGEGGRG